VIGNMSDEPVGISVTIRIKAFDPHSASDQWAASIQHPDGPYRLSGQTEELTAATFDELKQLLSLYVQSGYFQQLPVSLARSSLERITMALDRTAKKLQKARRLYKAPQPQDYQRALLSLFRSESTETVMTLEYILEKANDRIEAQFPIVAPYNILRLEVLQQHQSALTKELAGLLEEGAVRRLTMVGNHKPYKFTCWPNPEDKCWTCRVWINNPRYSLPHAPLLPHLGRVQRAITPPWADLYKPLAICA
jgi:hypothetical protein